MLKSGYIVGLLMVALEVAINVAFGFTVVSGIIIATMAGYLYSVRNKIDMPRAERLKATAVYILIVGGVLGFGMAADSSLGVVLAMSGFFLFIYGSFIYFSLYLGSHSYVKALEMKKPASHRSLSKRDVWTLLGVLPILILFTSPAFWFATDPLTDKKVMVFMLVAVLLFGYLIVLCIWVLFQKRPIGIIVGIGVMAVLLHGAWSGFWGLYPRTTASVAEAEQVMTGLQSAALNCMAKKANLRTKVRSMLGLRRGLPNVASPMCNQESTNWPILPKGWAYNVIEDADVQDGTFTFSARSRVGDKISCTEKGCVTTIK